MIQDYALENWGGGRFPLPSFIFNRFHIIEFIGASVVVWSFMGSDLSGLARGAESVACAGGKEKVVSVLHKA